jgi:hypothetical protein
LTGFAQQAIEDDERCRRFGGKPDDPALGWVQPHLQCVEGEPAFDENDEFTVEHEGLRGKGPQVLKNFGKEARERFSGFGFDLHFIACANELK